MALTEAEELELLELEEQEAQQSSQSTEQPQGVFGAVGEALSSTPELQPYGGVSIPQGPSGPVSGALDAARQTLAAPMRVGATLGAATDVVGEGIATATGESNNPYVRGAGVAVGGAVQMAPYLLGAYALRKGLYASQNPAAKGLLNTPQELGPQYSAQNKAIGISADPVEFAGKQQFESPYQHASQLTKAKYVKPPSPDLPVIEPGSKTGDPHALFAYPDRMGPEGSPRNVYQVFGDPAHPELKRTGYASHVPAEQLGNIPVTGRLPSSVKYKPITTQQTQPISNAGGGSFTRPNPQVGIESQNAQPLPSSTPTKYANDPGTFINQANKRMDMHRERLNLQELYDYKAGIDQKMANGEIPKFGADGRPSPLYAQASAARSKATTLLNKLAEPKLKKAELPEGTLPTRAGLNKAYGIASGLQSGTRKALKYGSGVAGFAAMEEYVRRRFR